MQIVVGRAATPRRLHMRMPFRNRARHGMLAIAAAIVVGALGACATRTSATAESLATPRAQEELGFTPLVVEVHAGDMRGVGSGFLVHPRVLVTARHVLPPGTDGRAHVVAFSTLRDAGQAAAVDTIVRGVGVPCREGDWAVVVLHDPLDALGATVATVPEALPELPSRAPLLIGGFPLVGGESEE